MNEADWLKKYYPIPARKVEGTDLDLLDHSIKKWEGLLDLEQYGLEFVPALAAVRIKETCWIILFVDGESCALCKRYQKYNRKQLCCGKCPLAISLGLPCDQRVSNTDAGTFYHSLYNPQIMIDALKKARELMVYRTTHTRKGYFLLHRY